MTRLHAGSFRKGKKIEVFINGKPYAAHEGETVLAALTAAGYKILRPSRKLGEPRGALCGMGVCYECLVTINNRPNQKACMTPVKDRMEVLTVDA